MPTFFVLAKGGDESGVFFISLHSSILYARFPLLNILSQHSPVYCSRRFPPDNDLITGLGNIRCGQLVKKALRRVCNVPPDHQLIASVRSIGYARVAFVFCTCTPECRDNLQSVTRTSGHQTTISQPCTDIQSTRKCSTIFVSAVMQTGTITFFWTFHFPIPLQRIVNQKQPPPQSYV